MVKIQSVLSYIELHYNESISLQTTADAFGIKKGSLCQLIRKHTGMTFYEYLSKYRNKKALELMAKPNVLLKNIAEQVGYPSYQAMARSFRKFMFASPYACKTQLVSNQDIYGPETSCNNGADIKTIIKYIDDHYLQESLTLLAVADHFHLTETYLCSKLKKALKMNFYLYLQKIKIDHAKALMYNNNISLTDIAIRSGFSNYQAFCRAFKKLENCTPGSYKKSLHERGITKP